ncbi:hypothetical protein C1H46_015845 [Malus baccata]|uniref:Alcohol dehydrogenase-like C-terminal domain-containing protein n=1 Tax=Malus baccata TaxID=106549 RepID=A0A540MIH5_MALBA|nr:hypothetical protein C1H46_015845 [Malus baccata]
MASEPNLDGKLKLMVVLPPRKLETLLQFLSKAKSGGSTPTPALLPIGILAPSISTASPELYNWTVHGLYWGSYKIHRPGVLEESLKELLSWVARGLISIHISHAYCLPEANLAFSAIKDRKVIGKVMLVLDDERSARSKL